MAMTQSMFPIIETKPLNVLSESGYNEMALYNPFMHNPYKVDRLDTVTADSFLIEYRKTNHINKG